MITFKVWTDPEGLEDLVCPVVVCDGCREPITGPGNVLWHDDEGGQVWHVHKGFCDRKVSQALRQATGIGHEKSRELTTWLSQLQYNVAHPWQSTSGGDVPHPAQP